MLKRIFISLAFFAAVSTAVTAQNICSVNGKVDNRLLLKSSKKDNVVTLSRRDEFNNLIPVESARIKGGEFSISCKLDNNATYGEFYYLSWPNSKEVTPVFIENGDVSVYISKTSSPEEADVKGTANNNLMTQYKNIRAKIRKIEMSGDNLPLVIENDAEALNFILANNGSPVAPYLIENYFLNYLSDIYVELFFKALMPELKMHPYTISLANEINAKKLKTGSEIPNIALPLQDGQLLRINDFRGKYILLNFWASNNEPSVENLKYLTQLYNATQADKDKFVIISLSLDTDESSWLNAIDANNLNKDGWIHASELSGDKSKAARLFGVDSIPYTALIDPAGMLISTVLQGEELIQRVQQILSGDLYYENQMYDDEKK